MNRSKIIASTALASVMAATAANAEMSISGLYAGKLTDADGGGLASGFSTNSIYVSYSDSMDNGMGVSVAMSLTAEGLLTDVNFDTGMGVVGLGNGQDSSVDKLDGSPACFSLNVCGGAEMGAFNDGDAMSADSIMYTNSIAGWTVKVSRGEKVKAAAEVASDTTTTPITLGTAAVEGHDAVMSYATKGSFMGATIAAGMSSIDYAGATADKDPNFVTVSYSLAGLDLGYGMYDGDDGNEETQMGVGTSMAGMNVGVQFADLDATTDKDMMRVSVSKGMGAASFGLDYTETDVAGTDTGDSDAWNFMYVVGF